jgi:putative heme iron utilization protein
MDAMEQIENQLEERKQISESLGFMDLQHYEEFKESAANGMIRFGDSFIQVLGTALAIADGKNARKIMRYWHDECETHGLMQKMYLAKLNAE